MAIVLKEPFNNFSDLNWTNNSMTIVAGGQTGTGLQGNGTSEAFVTIPAGIRNKRMLAGFAYKAANFTANHQICQFRASGANQVTLNSNTSGAIEVRRGSVSGTILATSAINVLTVGTFNYIEFAVTVADAGLFTVWVDGAVVIGPDTAGDTIVAPDGTLMDSFVMVNGGTGTPIFDNLYLEAGTGVVKLGPQVLTTPFLWSPISISDIMYQQLALRYPSLLPATLNDLTAKFATDNPTFLRPLGTRTFYTAVDPETLSDAALRYWTDFVP